MVGKIKEWATLRNILMSIIVIIVSSAVLSWATFVGEQVYDTNEKLATYAEKTHNNTDDIIDLKQIQADQHTIQVEQKIILETQQGINDNEHREFVKDINKLERKH